MIAPDAPPARSPGEQAPAIEVLAATRRVARLALWAWLALALLLWASTWVSAGGLAAPLAMARRLGALVAPGLLFVVGPLLAWPLATHLVRGSWRQGVGLALHIGAISQLALAVIWSGVAVLAIVDGVDPLERVPWIFPPYLEDFARRHPHIEVIPITGVRMVHLRAAGQWIDADGNDLVDAEVSLMPCTHPPSAEQLGGLPLPDGLRCRARLEIRRPAGRRVTWQFGAARAISLDELRRPYEAWAKAVQAELRTSGYKEYRLELGNASRRWDLKIRIAGNDTRLEVAEGGLTRPWPDRTFDVHDVPDEPGSQTPGDAPAR